VGADPLGLAAYVFDGTNNDKTVDPNPTNPAILGDAYIGSQYYESGPGTDPGVESVIGAATGYGSRYNIQGAYDELVRNFNKPNHDREIVIFGFSRGSAAAREFANKIYREGMPDLSSARKETRWVRTQTDVFSYEVTVYDRYFKAPEIKFMGIYDTVASMGVGGNKVDLTYDLSIAPNVKNVRHAISLEETRRMFPLASAVDLDNPNDPRIVEKGFNGVHSDVGGGYKDNNVASRRALIWMWQGATDAGVPLRPLDPKYTRLDEPIVWHDSRTGNLLWIAIDLIPDIKYGRHFRSVYHYHNPEPMPGLTQGNP